MGLGKFLRNVAIGGAVTVACPISAPIVALGILGGTVNTARSVSKTITDNYDYFKLTKIKDGISPSVIFINGFTNEGGEFSCWDTLYSKEFCDNECIHVDWNSQEISDCKNGFSGAILSWKRALKSSEIAGQKLAEYVRNSEKEFILVGHSLGARVIYNAMNNIPSFDIHRIHKIKLFGGAVSSDPEKWLSALKYKSIEVSNYYSEHDGVLKYLYKDEIISDKPIGLRAIGHSSISNYCVSKYIKGHSDYWTNFESLLKFSNLGKEYA